MEHRQRPEVDAVEGQSEAEAVAERGKIGATMTVDDAFRVAGRARGIEQAQRLPFVRNSGPVKIRVSAGEESLIGMVAYWRDRCIRRSDIDDDDLSINLLQRLPHQRCIVGIDD